MIKLADYGYTQQSQLPQQPQTKGGIANYISEAGGLAGGLLGSLVAPGLGSIAGAGIGAGLGQKLENKLTGKNESALKEGLYGAGGQAIGLGVGKLLGSLGKGAVTAGQGLRTSVVAPKVAASPFMAEEEASIAKALSKLGLKGSAAAQAKQLPGAFRAVTSQIDDVVSASTKKVSTKTLSDIFKKSLVQSTDVIESDPIVKKTAANLLKNITAQKEFTAKDLWKFKQSLNNNNTISKIFDKMEKSIPLNQKEAVTKTLWETADNAFSKLSPEAKQLTTLQSFLYKASPGIQKSAKEAVGIPLLGVKSKAVAGGLQAGKDLVGRALTSVPQIAVNPKVSGSLGQLAVQGMQGTPQTETAQSVDLQGMTLPTAETQLETPATNEPTINKDLFTKAIFNDFAQTGGKNVSQIMAVAKFLGVDQATSAKAPTAMQAQVGGYANRIALSNQIFDQIAPAVSGQLTGKLSISRNLPERFKSDVIKQQDQAERNFINAVLRRESGAAIAPSEFESAQKQYFPQPGDSATVLEQKRMNRYLVQQNLMNEAKGSSTSDSLGQLLTQLGSQQ